MKWRGCFLFFLLSFWLISGVRGQLISLSVKNASLEKVFLLIEQQSDHHFIYSNESLAKARPVTLSVSGETLNSVLKKCFASQPLQFTIHEKNITVKEKPIPRSIHQLKGKVVNEGSEPVPGLTITIRGYNLQTTSDANGNFQFDDVPDAAVLLVTGAEIEPMEIPVGNQSYMLITVQARISTLDETFVIAYGKSTRRYSTGTVTSIKKEEISKQPVSNPLAVLAGLVPGLQISQVSGTTGAPFNIRLRGQNSIANGNDPLIIIDGIPYPYGSLNAFFGGGIKSSPLEIINPGDIESIEVLKDADATAIYGSRGANGVILITTRKIQTGSTKFSLRSYLGSGRVAGKIKLLNTPDYLRMRKEAFANDGVTVSSTNAPDLVVWDSTRYTDWQNVLLGNAMHLTDTRLEFSGGNLQTQFLFGVGYHGESTVLPEKDFGENKLSANISIHHRNQNDRLRFSFRAGYGRNTIKLPLADISGNILLPPNAPAIHNQDGSLNWENSTWQNPFSQLLQTFGSESENLLTNVMASFQVIKNLELKTSIGYNMVRVRDFTRTPKISFDPATASMASAGFGNSSVNTLIIEPQLSYRFNVSQLRIEALSGTTLQSTNQLGFSQTGKGYASDDLLHSLRAAATISPGQETDIRYRYSGIFGRILGNWDQKYIVSLNGRRDGSSRFGPANRFANFGSIGLAWVFSNEKFLQKASWLSYGKLKVSGGVTGNDQIGDYNYLDLYSTGNFPYQGLTPLQPVQLFNPEYSWERVKKYEVGIDLGFLSDRILFTLNYYHNISDNQLVQYGLPPSTGFGGILKNLPAIVRNTGIEIELNATMFKSENFTWSSAFNVTLPGNKLLRFDNLQGSSYANTYVVGEPLFISKRFGSQGVDPTTGHYQFTDFDGDGKISAPNDQQLIVFTGQQYFGGFQNTMTWKQFSFSFLLQFVRNRFAPTYLTLFGKPGSFSNQPSLVVDRWTKPGDEASIQRYSYSNSGANSAFNRYRQSDAAFSDASFVRMRNLFISYTIPKNTKNDYLRKDWLIFIQGQNLFTLTKYESLDPETRSLMPPVKIISGGIQLTF